MRREHSTLEGSAAPGSRGPEGTERVDLSLDGAESCVQRDTSEQHRCAVCVLVFFARPGWLVCRELATSRCQSM